MKSINIMTCGSVDDGKSTLLGRLIYETDNLLEDQSNYLSKLNQKFAKKDIEIDYSLLLDGLIDEKEYDKQISKLGKLSFGVIKHEEAEVDKFCNNDSCEVPPLTGDNDDQEYAN